MNYSAKEFSEIFEPMIEDSVEKGLISHAEDFIDHIDNLEDISNYYVLDKSVIAYLISNIIYPDMTSVYESAKVEFAEGVDLDNLGLERGIERPKATHAGVNVTFTLNELQSVDVNIPEGVIVSTEDGVEYITDKAIYIPSGSLATTVYCKSVDTGVGTKIKENTLNTIVSNLDYDFTCLNENASSGGEDEYSDDEYRYLVLNWYKIHLKGSREAFEYYFANFDGIDGYKLVPNWNQSGTLKIILDPGTPEQLDTAYNEIKANVCQVDDDIFMTKPIDKEFDIYAVVNVDIDQINPYSNSEKEDIRNRILTAIKTFIDGGYTTDNEYYPGLSIGEDFIPHKLAVFLDDEIPELKNISFKYPEDYVEIQDEEIGVSQNINIEMI